MRFKDKVALVTGAGFGIGRAIACRLAEEGADIAIHDRGPWENMEETAKMVRERGRRVEIYQVDVSKVSPVCQAIAKTIKDFGQVHVLVNNAGMNMYKRVQDFTDKDWEEIVGTDLTGVWNYCRHMVPHFLEKNGGCIVNIGSVAGLVGHYYRAPYVAAKHGVHGLTKALALDLAESNIRVNGVAPGGVKTGMTRPHEWRFGACTDEVIMTQTPMRRWGEAAEVAAAVAFLASDDASYITGQILPTDGGYSVGTQIGVPWTPVPMEGVDLPWLTKLIESKTSKKKS